MYAFPLTGTADYQSAKTEGAGFIRALDTVGMFEIIHKLIYKFTYHIWSAAGIFQRDADLTESHSVLSGVKRIIRSLYVFSHPVSNDALKGLVAEAGFEVHV